MDNKIWLMAKLSDEQLNKVKQAEQTLDPGSISIVALNEVDSNVASLNESQLECLAGLEKKLGMVLVAYKKA